MHNEVPLKAFVSYKWGSEEQNTWVEKLATDLRSSGIDAFLDRWEAQLGESFTEYMTSRIDEADVILVVITSSSVAAAGAPKGKGGAVKFEMQMATARRTAGEVRIIGIYREGERLPAHLRDHRYADFRNAAQYQQKLQELIDDLRGRTQKPPLGGRKLTPREERIEKLQKEYDNAVSQWYQANYKHMDVDDELELSSEIEGWRSRFEEIEKELNKLGVKPRNKV